ncbi:MAG: hypothetical protein ACK5B9_09220 [Flavobacteriia bacterium]|jgi:epidermal growth factor receptor substrate 15
MRQFYIFFAFLCLSFVGSSQILDFDISTTDYATGKKLSNVTVEVYEGTNLVKSIVTPSNGQVKFNLPDGKVYVVFFSKAGKVTRQVKVNGKNIDNETIQGGKNALAYFSVSLFDQVGNIDYSYIEKNPITEFFFDGTNSKLAYDDVIAAKMDKKVKEILKQSEEQASKADALYQDAISKADAFFKQKNWQFALDKYTEASLIKKAEEYPIAQIKICDENIKKQKQDELANGQKEAEYKKIVATADALRDQGKYADAIAKYQEAQKIKDEQYLKDEINKANTKIANAKKAEEELAKYKAAMDNGETLFSSKKYTEAKAAFNQALIYKPNDPAALKRLADIDIKAKEEAEAANKKKAYETKITEAEQLLASNKLPEARAKFVEAKSLDPSQTLPDTKIKEIDAKIAASEQNKVKTEKYNAAMKAADDFFKANKLTEARAKYVEASQIDNTQSKPTENINKIDQLIADQEKAKKEKEKNDKIALLTKDAAALYAKNDLENAKKKYQEVLTLDDKNAEANSKINEINIKIAANQGEAEKAQRFKDLKASANQLMAQKKWLEAKQAFNEAKSIKADAEIDAKLKEIEAEIAKENAKLNADQQYTKILEDAKNLEASNIDLAISKYKEAQKIKPNDPIPTAKIKELEAKKANNSVQAETDKKYADAMKKGNDAMLAENYADAVKFFNEAGKLKPNESEPSKKAKEAEDLSNKKSQTEEEKNYNKILTAGQNAINEKNWTKAKEMYNRALGFRPNDVVPKNKLKEIDELIKAEEDAKKGNLDKETAYKNKLTQAENAVKSKEYDKAIALFEEAKALKSTDPIPQKRIDEVKALRDKETAGNQSEKMYQEYMNNGNNALANKNYTQALSEFKNALSVKKNDKTATAKINEVQQLIDNETNAGVDTEFNKFKAEADAYFDQKKWKEAKETYEKALSIKNDKPTSKKYKEAVANWEKDSEYRKQYKKVIDKADEYLAIKNYDKAKEYYNRAITLNTSLNLTDSYPVEKLKEIDGILNPVAVAPVGPLSPLGEPTNETPEEAIENLKKAQAIREQSKNNVVVTNNTSVQNSETETTDANTNEIYDNQLTLEEVQKKNSENTENGDLNRQNTVDVVENKVQGIAQNNIESTEIKYNENLNTTETVKNVNSEVTVDYNKKDVVYTENAESVKVYNQNAVNQEIKDDSKNYNSNIQNQTELASTMVKVDENVQSDYEERKKIDDEVKDVNAKITKNEISSNAKESDNILNVDTKLQKETVIRNAKETEDAKTAGNNAEELEDVELKIVKKSIIEDEKSVTKSLKSDEELALKNKSVSELPAQQDVNRKTNVDIVKKEGFTIEDKTRDDYNQNIAKRLASQGEITKTDISSAELTETKINDQKAIHAEIDGLDKNSKIAYSEKELSDDEQRANTKNDVNNTAISTSSENIIKASKVEGNISEVQNVATESAKKQNEEELLKKQNLENSQVSLNKISSKEMKYDDKVANSLGSTYPEGVSQEVFNQKDENGLLVAVVTRRIVVKAGYGQIYVRTQSLNGTTYSKNGEPSSEFIWQKETQDAKLKRNY